MKRIAALLLSLLLAAMTCTAMAEPAVVKPGDELSFDISISSAAGTEARIGIRTNSSPVTFVDAKGGSVNDVVPPKALNGSFVVINAEGVAIAPDGGSISGTPTGIKALENGKIGTLTIRVSDSAASGTYSVTAYVISGSVTVAGGVEFVVEGGTGVRLAGDANNDGEVSTRDALEIMRWIAGFDVIINERNADCNGDSEVTTRDALNIMQWIAGFDVTLH